MLKELKRQIVLNRSNLLVGLAISSGTGIFVAIMANLAAVLDADTSALPPLASILFLCTGLFYSLLMGLLNTTVFGDMGLKFGALRRRLFPALFLVYSAYALVLAFASRLWVFVDRLASRISGVPMQPVNIAWYWLVAAAFGVGLVGIWLGAMLLRYGKKAFWVVMVLYMAIILFGTRIAGALAEDQSGPLADAIRSVAAVVARLPIPGLALLAALLVAAIAVHSVLMLRRVAAQ